MQTQINQEEAHDEFEDAQDEILTYVLSQQISSPLTKRSQRATVKISEKPRLQLVMQDKEPAKQFNFREANRNVKRSNQTFGKIIKIGNVTFRSNFQCGNINAVQLTGYNSYQIELQRETNSNRISSWFYFNVQGVKGQAHFVIRGFTKSSSLFNEGMKICYRDTKDMPRWRRGGTRISYTMTEEDNQDQKHKYQLRFSHFFKNNEITCIQFAYCFPYGLKKLTSLLNHVRQHADIKVLAKTFNGQNIPLLHIGNKQSDKVIILSARVHPGQTVSSFIMEGFLKQLVSDNQHSKLLRSRYLFKVVPMLNPDGVVKGNYRFSGFGCDLNRKWKNCKESNQPQIYFMKDLIRQTNKQKKVIMYIDMHGHSRKKNVFFYGCVQKSPNPNPKPKAFPYIMEKIHDAFKYENCSFAIQKDKQGTARVTVWNDLKIDYVYTLESSFCGSEYGPNYLEADYQKIGRKLCEGITCLFYEDILTAKITQNAQNAARNLEKFAILNKKAVQELVKDPKLLFMGQDDDNASESEPEIGEINDKQRNPETGLPKPEAFQRQNREDTKQRRMKISTKISQQTVRQVIMPSKMKSEINYEEQTIKKVQLHLPPQKPENNIILSNDKFKIERAQIKIANSVNTFELQTLRASSLHHRNVRVHSITKNTSEYQSQRSKKVVNHYSETATHQQKEKESRLRVNLIHGREGAQYRRVRRIAEQNMKKEMVHIQGNEGKMVKQLHAHNLTNHLQLQNTSHAIAPRFYPTAHQRTRKASLESYIKKQPRLQQLRRISINGDQLNVRCCGKQVYL